MDRREQDVLDKLKEKTAGIETPEKLKPEHILQMLQEKEKKSDRGNAKKRNARFRKAGLLAAVCAAAAAGLIMWGMPRRAVDTAKTGNAENYDTAVSDSEKIAHADSYEQVYGYIEAYQKAMNAEAAIYQEFAVTDDLAVASDADTGMSESNDSVYSKGAAQEARAETEVNTEASEDYSETNVRQEGVDEGDIVKTDGRYLYVLEDNGKEIAVVDTKNQDMEKAASIDAGDNHNIYEFYVIPKMKKLTLICSQTRTSEKADSERESVEAITYDIEDPLNPEEEGRVSQSGSYSSSRVADGYLYLFSEYYIWNEADQNEPRTFVPLIGEQLVEEKDIYLPPISQAYMYEVVTAVDLEKPGDTSDSKAIFSKGGQIYVSNANIYFYETEWGYSDSAVTTVRKISYKEGKLEAEAQGKFDGYLNDSFSIDEYKGNLRVVTTEGDTNSVYILNDGLKEIGSIENLAKDERVYSARFMGDTGYFVTFRETDPLFSVDLSNPENPEIIGKLKIPGFSDYLHFYGENRLLGIGMNVDEETIVTDGVKITMFDISDKTDVKEADTYVLKNVYYTEVSYDYKAALVDPERNIIGFPGDTQGGQKYYLFEYDEDNGFVCNMEEEINGNGMRSARGVYIEDILYVVKGNIIEAYSLKDYKKVDDLIL